MITVMTIKENAQLQLFIQLFGKKKQNFVTSQQMVFLPLDFTWLRKAYFCLEN